MIASKQSKIFYFCLFLLPAFLLYAFFFIVPLYQGIKYSFTDWNGIVPEIPFIMSQTDFEVKVIKKLQHQKDLDYLSKYYTLDDANESYHLNNWIKEGRETRQISTSEKRKIKRILKSVGINPIKYIGFQNYHRPLYRTGR